MAVTFAATVLIVVTLCLSELQARKIPNYVKLCKKSDPDFDACLINSVESLRPKLNKGIPKMLIPPIDPFVLPALEVNRDLEAIRLKALLQNIVAYGGSGFIINRLKTDLDKLAIELSVTLPHIDATADYDVEGRVLVAPIKGKGVFKGNFTDVKVDVKADANVVTKNGEEYLEVNNIKTKIRIGDSNVKINVKDDRSGLLTKYLKLCKRYQQNLESCLMRLLESAKSHLPKGIPELGVPPLDPYKMKSLQVNRGRLSAGFRTSFKNIKVTGGTNFKINRIMVDLPKMELFIDVNFPMVNVTLDYDVDGKIVIIPIKGKGQYIGYAKNVHPVVRLKASVFGKGDKEWLELKKVTTVLKIGQISINLNKTSRDQLFSPERVNAMKKNRKLLTTYLTPIMEETASEIISNVVSNMLSKVSYTDFLPLK